MNTTEYDCDLVYPMLRWSRVEIFSSGKPKDWRPGVWVVGGDYKTGGQCYVIVVIAGVNRPDASQLMANDMNMILSEYPDYSDIVSADELEVLFATAIDYEHLDDSIHRWKWVMFEMPTESWLMDQLAWVRGVL